ncbi:MAG: hypothetical protein ACRC8Y_24220, partial [Chroococcales cyanobacterium]
MTVDTIQKITVDADLSELKQIIRSIIGEICWSASLSYGDELTLDIGEKIPYKQKVMAGKYQGEWILGTRGSEWSLESASGIITSTAEPAEVFKEKVKVIEGTTITDVETNYPDLVLIVGFSNGYQLKVFPDLEDDFDLSYWELFTPNNRLVTLE